MRQKFWLALFAALFFVSILGPRPARGNMLTPEVVISQPLSPDRDRYHPAVAYNSNLREYLVAWHQIALGTRQVYTRLVSRDGTPLGYPNRITAAEWRDNFQPAVAYDETDDQYLVVWMVDADGDGKRYEIWGQLLRANNEPVALVFRIYTWANRKFWTPKVVWNKQTNKFYVIWNAFDATTDQPTDIAGIHVSADGVPEASATIITTSQSPHQANLAYNYWGGKYFIVWRHYIAGNDWDIYGIFLDADGNILGSEFPINIETVDSQLPAVACSHGYCLVVWQHWAGNVGRNVWDIVGQFYKPDGTLLIDPFPIAASNFNAMAPAVAASHLYVDDFLTVFQQDTALGTALRARQDRLVGDVLNPALEQFEVSAGNFWKNTNPAVAAANSRDGYLIAYEGDSTGDPTVYQYIFGRAWLATQNFTVSPKGTGNGTVTGSGINCSWSGSASSGTCSVSLTQNTAVHLSAYPSLGSSFGGWLNGSGSAIGCNGIGDCAFAINATSGVEAYFALGGPNQLRSIYLPLVLR
jgi:hypothetical protein